MNDPIMVPGSIVITKKIDSIVGNITYTMGCKSRKERMAFLFLGIGTPEKPLDPVEVLKAMGWTPSPELLAQFEKDKPK